MKIKELLLATLAVAATNIIIGMLTCGSTFSWVYKLEPTNVWKSMDAFSLPLMVVTTVFVDLIFVYVYSILKEGIPTDNNLAKGFIYGICVWAVGIIPGMVSTQLYMTVATTVVIYWTIWGLIVNPIKGMIAAAIYKD